MATTGKKEYTLKINGISEEIKNATSLLDALKAVNSEIERNTTITTAAAKPSKEKARALTEEEKAAKKLEETQQKVKAAQEGANDAQIKANQALREATREQTLRIQGEQASINSIEAMRIKLSQLKDDWKGLDVGTEEFRAMSEEIRVLNDQIKEAEQSTGDFRRNVGNYGSALEGLGRLSEGIDGVTKSSIGLAQGLLGANALMGMFGEQTEEDAKRVQQLQKIIALLSIAQQVNTNVLKEGIVQNKLAVVTDTIRTTQIKAKTAAEAASTKGTVAATIAQRIFNAVASANPYVLLALALVAVGAALFAFASNTDNAADKQKKLNDLQSNYLDTLEEEANKTREASNERVAALERQLRELKAAGASLDDIHKKENEIASERRRNNAYLRGYHAQEINDLDENKAKIDELRDKLRELQRDKLEGKGKVKIEVDGKTSKVKIDEAIDAIQGQINNLGRTVKIATDLTTENAELNTGDKEREARQKQELNTRAKTAAEAAKKCADTELSIVRAAEDARIKLIQDSNEQTRKTLALTYDRQIEDQRKRLTTEKDLTVKARAALNETITSLEKQKGLDLEKLEKEQANRALALQQELEDSRIALIVGNYDRQTAEVNLQYDRQIEAYKKRLDEDKTLTEGQQKQITELIINAQKERGIALVNMTNEQLNQQTDLQLTAVEDALRKVENKVGEVVVRSKTGLELIDVKATRDNFDTLNKGLTDYIKGLAQYQIDLKKSHEDTLKTMQEGTPEYEAEVGRYARAYEEAAENIKSAQKEIEDNTKISARIQGEAFAELIGKISEYANAAASALTSVFDTWNMGLQVEMDDLNKQLDAINERYEEAQKQREGAVKNVEDIEAQLQTATGGTAEALKEQLQDSMSARNEAIRAEQKLAKEKERIEAEQAKKEKQMKRNDLLSQIAQTVANTAAGVAKAVAASPLTFGLPWSAFVAATGALQTGIMVKQLTKLANGGEIVGPSHSAGGVPILVNGEHRYEAQGGEFMVNDKSYGANKPLVNFINDTPRTITAADLFGMVPNDATPVVMVEAGFPDEDRIIEAINGINFQPVVAVKDINDVSDEVVTVKDLADF